MIRPGLSVLLACTILSMQAPAMAQDVPSFRVPIGSEGAPSSLPPVHAWMESVSSCSSSCGTGTRTVSHQCQNVAEYDFAGSGYGAAESDAACSSAGPRPADATRPCTNYSGCGYEWVRPPVRQTAVPLPNPQGGEFPVGRVGCGHVRQEFQPYCRRTGGEDVRLPASDHAFCRADRPNYDAVAAGDPDALGFDRRVTQTAQCSTPDHDWKTDGSWSSGDAGWSSDCSANATRIRTVTCERRFDGTTQTDGECAAGGRPASSETAARYGSCSYRWVEEAWGAWSSGCSGSAERTRAVRCERSNDGGTTVADGECTSRGLARPETRETAARFESCSYSFNSAAWSPWSSTCSTSATRTRSNTCRRSDGTDVAASECTTRGVAEPAASETAQRLEGCGYAFETGEWSGWSQGCSGSAMRTRSVTCRRSDGSAVADGDCTANGRARPASSETGANYASCSYSRGALVSSSGWSSTCSANATRTNSYQCVRSDGTPVAAAECSSRGVAVTETQTAAVYEGCGYGFQTGSWSSWSSGCSANATRSRSVTCMRADGSAMPDAECINRGQPRPASSEFAAQYGSCTYRADYGQISSSCTNGSQTRSMTACHRSDGTQVANSFCQQAGLPATRTESCQSDPNHQPGSICQLPNGQAARGNINPIGEFGTQYGYGQQPTPYSRNYNGPRDRDSFTAWCTQQSGSCVQGFEERIGEHQSGLVRGGFSMQCFGAGSRAVEGMYSYSYDDGHSIDEKLYSAWNSRGATGTGRVIYRRDHHAQGVNWWPVNGPQNPVGDSCRAAGGNYEEWEGVYCSYVTDNYRQDYDCSGTEVCRAY